MHVAPGYSAVAEIQPAIACYLRYTCARVTCLLLLLYPVEDTVAHTSKPTQKRCPSLRQTHTSGYEMLGRGI